jgi:hypothetical protein
MAGNHGYAVELLLVEEQLAALERSAERLRIMNDDTPSAEIEFRLNGVIDQVEPLERRRQEILADLEMSANVAVAPLERQPPLTEIQAKVEAIRKRQKSRQQATANFNQVMQPELDFLSGIDRKDEGAAKEQKLEQKLERERSKLLPARYTNRDFFVADIFGYSLKDDAATMEAPVFSLKTQKDFSVWEWTSKDGARHIEVSPSVKYGRATMHDKSVLIFVTSQMTEALNRERPDAQNRAVRFTVHNYLVATNKPTGGVEYGRLETTLDRLKGTTIKTSIRTGDKRVKEAFGIIDSWTIVERSPNDERMIAVEVVLSKWLYNAIQAHEVLTLHPDYFRLRKPLERRLYELARKHCGEQSSWTIGLELLREKCGAQSHLRAFKSHIQGIAQADTLPEYRMIYSDDTDQMTFYPKGTKRLLTAIATGKSQLTKGRDSLDR